MFWASSVPIIRSYQLYIWQLVCFMQVMWPLPRRVKFYFVTKLYMFRASTVPIIRSYQPYTWQLVRNSTCFGCLLCPSSGVISCTRWKLVCFMQIMWPLPRTVRLELRYNLTVLSSGHITCMKHTHCHVYS
jgi:hypothetical protein